MISCSVMPWGGEESSSLSPRWAKAEELKTGKARANTAKARTRVSTSRYFMRRVLAFIVFDGEGQRAHAMVGRRIESVTTTERGTHSFQFALHPTIHLCET